MFKKFMPMVNTTLGPTFVAGKTDTTSYSIPAGWVTQTVTRFASCLLVDGEQWEKIIERAPQWNGLISTDATRGALCPKLLPTNDRLIVMFYYYAPGETNVSDEQKQHLKGRWLELNGSEQSFKRWIGHHEVSFRTGITFTEDGHTFSPPQPLFDPSWRVWRPHTFDGRHYVIGFRCHGQPWRISPELERMIPVGDSIEMFESASLFASEGWSPMVTGQRHRG